MTSKERMMVALEGGKPDRMPVSVHQWQGYHLDKYLGGISDIQAFERFGMDAQIQYFECTFHPSDRAGYCTNGTPALLSVASPGGSSAPSSITLR